MTLKPLARRNIDKHELAIKSLDEVGELVPGDLARTTDLSKDINFEESVPLFHAFVDTCNELRQRDLSRLPSKQLDAIANSCTQIKNLAVEVQTFDLNQDKPGDVCEALRAKIDKAYDNVLDPLLLPLCFTATQATDYARIEREAKGVKVQLDDEYARFSDRLVEIKREADEALEAVRGQAAEAGVANQSQIFSRAADRHSAFSKAWFKGTVVSALATLVTAVAFLGAAIQYTPANTAEAIQYVFAKVVVLSALSFAVFWSARNYRAERHNETINRHRADALLTFRAFVEGGVDVAIRDAVLLQAANAAFCGRPTGFDGGDGDGSSVHPIVDVLGRSVHTHIDAAN